VPRFLIDGTLVEAANAAAARALHNGRRAQVIAAPRVAVARPLVAPARLMAAPVVAAPRAAAPPLAALLPMGANLVLKAARSGQSDFAEVDSAKKLYILKGTRVEFKAAAKNTIELINFSTAAWSGNAGAAATGASYTLTFNQISASNTVNHVKTVTVTFGGQSLTINCIVYELTAALTPDDNFNGRSLIDFGVDERIKLNFTTTPVGISAADVGGLKWVLSNPSVSGRTAGGEFARSANPLNGKADYTAPYLTALATNLNPPTTKPITLKLAVQSGPSKDLGIESNITIHMPSAHMKKRANSDKHANGMASAGFLGDIYLTPKTVSFKTLRWREAGGRSKVTGAFPANWGNSAHAPSTFREPRGMAILGGDLANGCKIDQTDDVWSGGLNYVPPVPANAATVAGTAEWPILWQYRPEDLASAGWVKFMTAYHVATLYQTGRMRMTKGHQGVCAECTASAEKEIADRNERFP
jgi:hypothetical protein